MKTIDQSELKKKKRKKNNKQRQKGARETKAYSERVSSKSFCCAFKLGFLQLIYKASLIFKSTLELPLSIIL